MICYRCIHSEIIFLTVLNKDTKLLHISHSLRLIILLVNGKALFQPFLEKGSTYSPIYLIYGGQLYNSPTLEEEHISQYLTEALMNESSRLSSLTIDRSFTINGGNPYDVRTSYK